MSKTQMKKKFLKAFPDQERIFNWVWNNMMSTPTEKEFSHFVDKFNEFWGTRYTNKNIKAKTQFKHILEGGYSDHDYDKVFSNIKEDTFHIENDYKYVTPEYVSRMHIFERYLNKVKTNNSIF